MYGRREKWKTLRPSVRPRPKEARDLPDTDNFLCNIKRCLGQEKDVTDPYVAVQLDSTRIITTSVSESVSRSPLFIP